MNESAIKRRVWIRNIIIIFLLVILVLTFCSNTILNYSLPEVAVQYPQYSTITSRIRTSASVEANQSYSVTIEQTRVVSSVEVRVGQKVAKGDVLLRLEEGDSSELEAAKDALANLNIQLIQKMKQDPANNTDTSGDTIASLLQDLENARADLADAKDTLALLKEELAEIEGRKAALPSYDQLEEAKGAVQQAEVSLEYFETEIARLSGKQGALGGNGYYTAAEIEQLLAQAQSAYSKANSAYSRALVEYDQAVDQEKMWTERTEAAKKTYDGAARAVSDYESSMGSGSITLESLMQAQRALQQQAQEIEQAKQYFSQNEYNTARANYLAAKNEYDSRYSTATPEELAALRSALTAAENIYKPLESEYQSIQSLERAYALAQQSYQRDYYTYLQSVQQNSTLTSLKNAADSAKAEYDDMDARRASAAETATAKKEAYEKAKTTRDDAEAELKRVENYQSYDELSGEIKELTRQKTEVEKEKKAAEALIESASDANIRALDAELNAKNREITAQNKTISGYEKSISSLSAQIAAAREKEETDRENDKLDNKQYQIELQQIKDAIKKQNAEIARLEDMLINGTVTAPVSGTIESLSVSVGKKAEANTPLVSITLSDMGYTMKCSLTSEQAARVRVGDTATIQWYYWGDAPTARVTSIVPDAASQGKNKTVTLEVTGDVTVGTSLTFTLGEKNASYDCVVPNSAVREDSDGKFVLVVTAKSTPLGNRYSAKRVSVEVLASDDTNSAVSGQISGEYVITTSTTPISNGMQVRLSDN